ncbi:MAG: RNA polymerase sigma factor [Phycisphaerales bacterium JB038]
MPNGDRMSRVLERAAAGEERAWREIVEAYSGRVFALLRVRCGDPDLAEEMTQSCFCTVAIKLSDGGYLEQGKFEAWLFRIAINRLRDEKRRQRRQATPVEHGSLAALADEQHSGGRGADSSQAPASQASAASLRLERLAAVQEAVLSLPEADVELLQMRHFGGLAFRQIADALGQPLGTVLARHHRALKKLRELLDEAELP